MAEYTAQRARELADVRWPNCTVVYQKSLERWQVLNAETRPVLQSDTLAELIYLLENI